MKRVSDVVLYSQLVSWAARHPTGVGRACLLGIALAIVDGLLGRLTVAGRGALLSGLFVGILYILARMRHRREG